MGWGLGLGVNKKGCTPKPVNRPKGAPALQGGEEVRT